MEAVMEAVSEEFQAWAERRNITGHTAAQSQCLLRVPSYKFPWSHVRNYAAQSLRCETVLGAADTAQAAAVLWSFGEKGNTRILDILETNLHLKC